MKKADEHIENLIALYYAGEAGEEEKKELLAWVEESPDNRQYFYDSGKLWRSTGRGAAAAVDVDHEWEVLQGRLARGKAARRRSISMRRMPVRVAAAAAIFVAVALTVTLYNHMRTLSFRTAAAPASVLLPDSSHVTLNAWSVLRYPRRFRGGLRRVHLDGEAFFEVTRNETLPFVVEAAGAEVRVLGTSFNVAAYDTAATVEVVVNTGRVALSPKKDPSLTVVLEPGTRGVFDALRGAVTKTRNTDPNYLAWKTKKIVFENEELTTIVQTLNRVYHADIIITGSRLGACRVTTTFDSLSLDAVLEILRTTLDLEIVRKGDRILLKGDGCDKWP